MSKTIPKPQYLQLVGIKALSDRYQAMLDEIELVALEITGSDRGDHISDCLYGARGLDEALDLLGISVENPNE